jgi:hypothetical protein
MQKFSIGILASLLVAHAHSNASVVNISTETCNGAVLCATNIENFSFQDAEYNIQFLPLNFYETYPNGSGWFFWNDQTKAQAAATSLVMLLKDAGISGVTDTNPSSIASSSGGFSIPYQYYNNFVVYSITGASNSVDPATWTVWSPGTTSLWGLYVPIFTPTTSVPEPNGAAMALSGIFLSLLALKVTRRNN